MSIIIIFVILLLALLGVLIETMIVLSNDNTSINTNVVDNKLFTIISLSDKTYQKNIDDAYLFIAEIIDVDNLPQDYVKKKATFNITQNPDNLGGGTQGDSTQFTITLRLDDIEREVNLNNKKIDYVTYILIHEITHALTVVMLRNNFLNNLVTNWNGTPPLVYTGVSGIAGYKELLTTNGYSTNNIDYMPLNTKVLPPGNANNWSHNMEYEAREINGVTYPTFPGLLMTPLFDRDSAVDNFTTPVVKGIFKDCGWPVKENSVNIWPGPVPSTTDINAIWVTGGFKAGTTNMIYSKFGTDWQYTEGVSMNSGINDIVSRNNYRSSDKWVAVGNDTNNNYNKILYSNNGVNWFASTGASFTGTDEGLVAGFGNKWVALGSGSSSYLYSDDGEEWFEGSGPFLNNPNGIAYSGSSWIAVTNDKVLSSSDGVSWVEKNIGNNFIAPYKDVSFGKIDGLFLWHIIANDKIVHSSDFNTWTEGNGVSLGEEGVVISRGHDYAYGDIRYLVSGINNTVTSLDGLSWSNKSFNTTVTDLEFGMSYALAGANWLGILDNKIYNINNGVSNGIVEENLLTNYNKITYNYTKYNINIV